MKPSTVIWIFLVSNSANILIQKTTICVSFSVCVCVPDNANLLLRRICGSLLLQLLGQGWYLDCHMEMKQVDCFVYMLYN